MSIVNDLVKGVVDAALQEILKKTTGTRGRTRRRRRRTATDTLSRIEKLLRPARRSTSRRKSTRTRSTAQKRRVAARTRSHKKSLRRGSARR
ncbi:MAG TPA: hypothetical protein VMF90_20765 [Rhizobiaceae bacterium]|nr:hypothetical protein [Rhizobiaceae bacterium]